MHLLPAMQFSIRFALILLAPIALGAQQLSPELTRVDSLILAQNVTAAASALDAESRKRPNEFQVLWRLSRVTVLQGDAAPAQSPEQVRLYRLGLAQAERAVRANPTAPEGYLRRAAAAGKVALFSGVFDAADFVLQTKADAERVIAMRDVPAMTLATAHYILGRTHLKLTETPRALRLPLGLGFGNLNDALANLRRAQQLRPGFIMFELELGRALAEARKPAEARTVLGAIAALRESEPGDAVRKREALEALHALR